MRIRNLIVLILILHSINGSGTTSNSSDDLKSSDEYDYTSVIFSGNGFVAASQDRIDWISDSGVITKSEKIPGAELNSLIAIDQLIVAAGNNSLMLISSGKDNFSKIDCGTNRNINTLTFFKEKIIAAADGGEIAVGNVSGLFKTTHLDLKGDIVSISANTTDCFGVTDQGEIIHSRDGISWSVFDFNKAYEGFYKTCQFTKVLATEKQISIIGSQDDGLPVMFYSNLGTVWTQRILSYTDKNGASSVLNDNLNDIYYDLAKDQFFLVGNHGIMMTIPSCSHCNKLFEIGSANIKGISGNENTLIVVGEGAYFKTEQTDNF